MNATHTYSPLQNLAGRVLFLGFALTTSSLNAQTFGGRDYLAESPVSVQAFISPDAHKIALRIRLENRTSNAVRIRIVNEDQKVVYDDYIARPTYYGRFDLSALPYGAYTIELSNRNGRQTQPFRIELQTNQRIVMVTNPPKRDSLLARHRFQTPQTN